MQQEQRHQICTHTLCNLNPPNTERTGGMHSVVCLTCCFFNCSCAPCCRHHHHCSLCYYYSVLTKRPFLCQCVRGTVPTYPSICISTHGCTMLGVLWLATPPEHSVLDLCFYLLFLMLVWSRGGTTGWRWMCLFLSFSRCVYVAMLRLVFCCILALPGLWRVAFCCCWCCCWCCYWCFTWAFRGRP